MCEKLTEALKRVFGMKSSLIMEILHDKVEDVLYAISARQNLNFESFSTNLYVYPLSFAAFVGRVRLCKIMAEIGGADPNFVISNDTFLYFDPESRVVVPGMKKTEKMILVHGWSFSPTSIAFLRGNFQALDVLLESGGDLRRNHTKSLLKYFLKNRRLISRGLCKTLLHHKQIGTDRKAENKRFSRIIESIARPYCRIPEFKDVFLDVVKLLIYSGFKYEASCDYSFDSFVGLPELSKILKLDRVHLKMKRKLEMKNISLWGTIDFPVVPDNRSQMEKYKDYRDNEKKKKKKKKKGRRRSRERNKFQADERNRLNALKEMLHLPEINTQYENANVNKIKLLLKKKNGMNSPTSPSIMSIASPTIVVTPPASDCSSESDDEQEVRVLYQSSRRSSTFVEKSPSPYFTMSPPTSPAMPSSLSRSMRKDNYVTDNELQNFLKDLNEIDEGEDPKKREKKRPSEMRRESITKVVESEGRINQKHEEMKRSKEEKKNMKLKFSNFLTGMHLSPRAKEKSCNMILKKRSITPNIFRRYSKSQIVGKKGNQTNATTESYDDQIYTTAPRNTDRLYHIPSYFIVNALIKKRFSRWKGVCSIEVDISEDLNVESDMIVIHNLARRNSVLTVVFSYNTLTPPDDTPCTPLSPNKSDSGEEGEEGEEGGEDEGIGNEFSRVLERVLVTERTNVCFISPTRKIDPGDEITPCVVIHSVMIEVPDKDKKIVVKSKCHWMQEFLPVIYVPDVCLLVKGGFDYFPFLGVIRRAVKKSE